jgi:putative FmdB family regulatory protein
MPIYEYRCPNGHEFEVFQSMAEDPISRCQVCGAPVERVFHPVAVHFKGKGFYSTDYARPSRSDGTAATKPDTEKSGQDGSAKKDSGGDKAKTGSSGD